VKRFVHVSSVAVYGRPDSGTIDETYEPRPFGAPYEDTKLAAERFAFDRGRTLGMEVACVRPPIIFGEHDRQFVPRLLGRLARRRVILIDGGRFPLNMVDVSDVVDVILRCCEQAAAIGEAFNVAASPPPLVRDVFEAIADAAGLPRPRVSVPRGVAMVLARVLDAAYRAARSPRPPMVTPFVVTQLTRDVVYDASKAHRVLGWTGGRDPLEGLRRAAVFHARALTSSSAKGTAG
jgi:nucleoside-diphosphate-sugar epimerase